MRRTARRPVALGVVPVLSVLATLMAAGETAGQVTVSTEVQGAAYPREPAARPAADALVRGWTSVEFDRKLLTNLDFESDAIVYASRGREAVLDGEAKLVWRGPKGALAGGLLRERWGRFIDSPLDPLGPANTPFSLVQYERRLTQPSVRGTAFLGRVTLDVYALAGARRQPLPRHNGRFGFGIPTRDVIERGGMADQAVAVRVSGTVPALDWSGHVFSGLTRRPTFVPRFTADGRLASVEAIYTQIQQFGADVETTRADWRFLAEGFGRHDAVDVTGARRTYGAFAAAAEYQRFGAFGGAYNLIPRVDVTVDTRGDRTDMPFSSSARAGIRIATTSVRPIQIDAGYLYDWSFDGQGVIAAIEKTLAESPTLNLGVRTTAFFAGDKPSVLDIWKDDFELLAYVRVELSR